MLLRGQFVTVGGALGVVVANYGDHDIAEDHVAMWYGEVDLNGLPRARTIPEEYAVPLDSIPILYH